MTKKREKFAVPFAHFREWFDEAEKHEPHNPNAMALATVGDNGQPSLRMVLLKDYDQKGFVFYTNLTSRKGHELQNHPKAALLFYWKSLNRQVRIEGPVEKVSDSEADTYFQSRPRGSRIGAWASEQSAPMEGRFDLEKRVAEYTAKFGTGKIPRPDHWSGFRLAPERMEFWKEGKFRLHDRQVFIREDDCWRVERLFP